MRPARKAGPSIPTRRSHRNDASLTLLWAFARFQESSQGLSSMAEATWVVESEVTAETRAYNNLFQLTNIAAGSALNVT